MSERALVEAGSEPRLQAHVRLRFDKVRDTWTLQAPERAFMLDGIAYAILSRCDGRTTVEGVVDDLCRAFDGAPREQVDADVRALLQDLSDKGVLVL
jgi:pyrroloquinoline quinone biosynthesis protein D